LASKKEEEKVQGFVALCDKNNPKGTCGCCRQKFSKKAAEKTCVKCNRGICEMYIFDFYYIF
jgi:hypothetical protein